MKTVSVYYSKQISISWSYNIDKVGMDDQYYSIKIEGSLGGRQLVVETNYIL